ncbi:hypothetical protein ACFOHS_23095 [Jhaorihella thermophila]
MPLSALPGRLAYVVGDSHPWSSGSYAARVHRVACALARAGIEVIVFGRPGLPWDMAPTSDDIEPELRIDGVRHVFLPGSAPPGASRRDRLRHAETALAEAFGIFRPALVLAASDWEKRRARAQCRAAVGLRLLVRTVRVLGTGARRRTPRLCGHRGGRPDPRQCAARGAGGAGGSGPERGDAG